MEVASAAKWESICPSLKRNESRTVVSFIDYCPPAFVNIIMQNQKKKKPSEASSKNPDTDLMVTRQSLGSGGRWVG